MSINAIQKINLPKGLANRNSFHATNTLAIGKKDENSNNPNIIIPKKKYSLVTKTQKIDVRIKSKLGEYQTEPNNENDRNMQNVKINLNKEVFSKKISQDEKKMTVEEEPGTVKEIKPSTADTDLNVIMKSAKDDSAIKEQSVEKNLKEQILGKILTDANNSYSTNPLNQAKVSASTKDSSMTNFSLKDEKSGIISETKVDSNVLIKTIKQINIESISSY